jgi:hypothetical protein
MATSMTVSTVFWVVAMVTEIDALGRIQWK